MFLIKLSLISIVIVIVTQAVAFDVDCLSENDNRRMRQRNFMTSGDGEYFFIHGFYILDKESFDNNTLGYFDQKRLKTPMVIRYTFESKILDFSTNRYNGRHQNELIFDLHDYQIGLEFKNKSCLSLSSNYGFYVMTQKKENNEKFGTVILHACKAYVNQIGLIKIQKVVILLTPNNIDDLDELIEIMMKDNYVMNNIEYREFTGNQSFCMCDSLIYYLNDCYASTKNGDGKVSSFSSVIIVAIMIIFVVSSAFILESVSKISE